MRPSPPKSQPGVLSPQQGSPEIKSPDYRPDPRRAVYVSGEIGPQLVSRLTPQILILCADSRAPITVYIDSPGGVIQSADQILSLLRSTDQDRSAPCRIITVATGFAGSAAADFLAAGDYAIAFPGSLIHFHGARTFREEITLEGASGVAKGLKESNNRRALALVKSAIQKFLFRYFSLRPSFGTFLRDHPDLRSNQDAFLNMVEAKLTPMGQRVFTKALARRKRYQSVFDYVSKSKPFISALKSRERVGTRAKVHAEMLRAMVNFELASNRNDPDWSFTETGLSQVADDFVLVQEYIGHHQDIDGICDPWRDFLGPDDQEKITEELLPLRMFFGALCYALQEEENPMTALDAFWLGLIDEVIDEDLPTERTVIEQRPL